MNVLYIHHFRLKVLVAETSLKDLPPTSAVQTASIINNWSGGGDVMGSSPHFPLKPTHTFGSNHHGVSGYDFARDEAVIKSSDFA